jgi:hypothetical protein
MIKPPINSIELFPSLNEELIRFLKSLSPEQWKKQTVAKRWLVKDVAAHLLDGNFRQLSLKRDGWVLQPGIPIKSYGDLVEYLNDLNADWVKAASRLSPQLIIELLESTNETVYTLLKNLDPFAPSLYPVNWAGETLSYNWFDIAREYTERWLHQQQIRDAVGNQDLLSKNFYYPALYIFMHAWPYASIGAKVTVVTGEGGGEWYLVRSNDYWMLSETGEDMPIAETIIDGDIAWKLFSKSIRKEDVPEKFEIKGNYDLGTKVLDMIAVMA